MDYKTFQPHPDLESLISCYWTLEIPKTQDTQRQRIIPDVTIEMAFILGDDIKRFTSEDSFIIQPRAMVLGHTIAPFYIEPTGYVCTFAIRFYPYGFANFVTVPIKTLENTETPLAVLFEEKTAKKLEQDIIHAANTKQRIKIIESFLLNKLNEQATVNNIVKTTIDTLLATKGSTSISQILKEDLSKRRQLERMFIKQIGVSPKQLGKLIRLQSALKAMLNEDESLTNIAYQNDYYDQSHFIKDFKEFTGVSPKEFLGNENMTLSSLFYK
ncbi:AraC family transcriptional regulator [Alginatibacterium sediminis]|uniref:AraC family transcriptional regulator n=1 Tax=Alginatibacterium sediminis TaxID=2164068 RepID=A0A420E9W6_9ALTE|nr:helix-turn-helix domain-containing protein [Alginatibacterium sediminis]RKF17473.1 AraC family transcriptional regulator [Alginatibacterium sediminis]